MANENGPDLMSEADKKISAKIKDLKKWVDYRAKLYEALSSNPPGPPPPPPK